MADPRTGSRLEREQPDAAPSRAFLGISYAVLFVGGLVAGLVGAFFLPYSVSPGVDATTSSGVNTPAAGHVFAAGGHGGLGQLLSAGLLIAILVNPALSFAGLRTAGTRLAAALPMVGWLVAVLPMLSSTSDGDNILPNNLRSIAFVLLGAIGFAGVTLLGRPTRGMTSAVSLSGAPRPVPAAPASRVPGSRPSAAKPASRRTAPKRGKRR